MSAQNTIAFDRRADDGGVRFLIIKTAAGKYLADVYSITSPFHSGESGLFDFEAFETYDQAFNYLCDMLCMRDEIKGI